MMPQDVVMTLLVNAAVFTVLFALMLAVRALLAKRISAVLQYALWAVVVVKLITPFGFESTLSPLALFGEPDAAVMGQTDEDTIATLPDAMNVQPMADDTAQPNASSGLQALAGDAQTQTQQSASGAYDRQTGATVQPMDWAAWVLIAWAIGALVVGAAQWVCAAKLQRCASHARLPVPDRVTAIFAACKRELGIKRHIDVVVQSVLYVPAIMGAVQPALVLPEDVSTQTDAQIRHICIHELTHFKRGDLVVITLMGALRAVYWFNPLVWLCFQLIRKDMETACDSRVLRHIGTGARAAYIGTVLQFAGRDGKQRLQAAMGMADGRVPMEQRIRAMFRRTRTGRRTKVLSLCVAALMLAMSVLTACQPTPEETIIVNRSELEEQIKASATPGIAYKAPVHWTDMVERGNLTVSADTNVTLPDVTQYPVTILEPVTLSQERVDELVAYFAGDSKLFCYPSVFTKADYQEQLIEARRGQLVDGEYVVTEATERYADSIEEKIANAPEDSPRIYTDTMLNYDTDLDGNVNYDAGPNYLNVGVEFEDGNEATISAHNFTAGYGNSTSLGFSRIAWPVTESWYQECLAYGDESESGFDGYGEILSSIDLNIDDARAQAEKVISDLGITDMTLVNEEKAVLAAMGNQYGVSSGLPDRGGYVFEYVRASGGIAGYQQTSFGTNGYDQEPDYSPPFFQEMLTISVSKNGIESFDWTGMAQLVETVSENVALLPFEDIQQALVDQIYYENAPMVEQFNESEGAEMLGEMAIKVDVLSAELRAGYISVEDNTQQAMLVPMWVFETAQTHSYGDEEGEPFASKTYQFNAIDGGVIMPSVGIVAGEEDEILAGDAG